MAGCKLTLQKCEDWQQKRVGKNEQFHATVISENCTFTLYKWKRGTFEGEHHLY
jgi:hypothetical protein